MNIFIFLGAPESVECVGVFVTDGFSAGSTFSTDDDVDAVAGVESDDVDNDGNRNVGEYKRDEKLNCSAPTWFEVVVVPVQTCVALCSSGSDSFSSCWIDFSNGLKIFPVLVGMDYLARKHELWGSAIEGVLYGKNFQKSRICAKGLWASIFAENRIKF